jgi:hypothetical protein
MLVKTLLVVLVSISVVTPTAFQKRSLDDFLESTERSNVVAREMGLLRSQKQPQSQAQTFQDFYENDRFESSRVSERKSGKAGKGGAETKTSSVGCCKLCPEQFQGLDVIPTQSFVEISSETKARKAGKSGKGGSAAAPPPPPVPLTIEQLIAQTPCCPVCLEQFDPPVDSDDSSFLEISEKFVVGSTAKAGAGASKGNFKCCTMCPNDSILPGAFEATASPSFLEHSEQVRKGGSGSKAGKGGAAGKDTRIKPDGCCNQCPASMFESAEIRFQEPQGGPFGLKPRVKSVSSAFPMQQPVP